MRLLNEEKVEDVLDDMKLVTAETAFVVRTFFFIIFGWSVYLGSLLSFKVIGIGLVILFIIYLVRAITLFIFNGKNIVTQLFLAPRGLITILLFFAIPEELSIGPEFQGVLLFVILVSCLVMTWSLISYKNKLAQIGDSRDRHPTPVTNHTRPNTCPARGRAKDRGLVPIGNVESGRRGQGVRSFRRRHRRRAIRIVST